MHTHKILQIFPSDSRLQELFSRELRISKVLAQILVNRGIKTLSEASRFLNVKTDDLLDPFAFKDMRKAVDLIRQSAKLKQPVLISGDYDVDGITSIAVLKEAFAKLGISALHYIPHRVKDGYGLNDKVVELAKAKQVKLVVTADCGTSNHTQIAALRKENIEVIVTDHHQPSSSQVLPASALINPKSPESGYVFKDLAGVGVAFKLAQALSSEFLGVELDLVALGTIADVVPLTGENRIIVKEGLKQLSCSSRIGIQSLIEVSRIKGREINSTFVSFIIGPRLNASGRVDTAETALNLLLSRSQEEADTLARALDAFNRQRQKIEGQIMQEAQDLIDQEVNFKDHKVIVVAKEGWHQGVLGIVASKLADRFYRPAIVISLSDDLCKGSGRSIKNFHLFEALLECQKHLHAFGGHSHAVGLTVTRENIEEFRSAINALAQKKLFLEDLIPSIEIDMELTLADINEDLVEGLKVLEPFGAANPEPLFYVKDVFLKGAPALFAKGTLKFQVSDGSRSFSAIGFGMASLLESLKAASRLDLVFRLQIDTWQGAGTVLLEIKEIFFK